MENKYKQIWNMKTRVRLLEEDYVELLQPEKDILAYIGCYPGASITEIVKHPYFEHSSLSTIKRSICKLLDEDLIYKVMSSRDKRVNGLYITEAL